MPCSSSTLPTYDPQLHAGINTEAFGLLADGTTDETACLTYLIGLARTHKVPLRLPYNGGTVVFNPTTTVDLTGIPRIEGNCTIDTSQATATTLFKVEGTRQNIATGLSLAEGDWTIPFTLPGSTTLKEGDRLIVLSNEALPNTSRTYYKKGEPARVAHYRNGVLSLQNPLTFTYTSASLLLIHSVDIALEEGVRFRGGVGQTGLSVKNARLISKASFEGFEMQCLTISACEAVIEGIYNCQNYSSSTPWGHQYAIAIGDGSEVIVNAIASASRHAVATGGGTILTSELGPEYSGNGSGIAVGSHVSVTGGIYRSYAAGPGYEAQPNLIQGIGALDCHGCTLSFNVSESVICFGGMTLGARTARVRGTIYSGNFSAIEFGDISASENAPIEWGDMDIDVTCIMTGSDPHPNTRGAIVMIEGYQLKSLRGRARITGYWGSSTQTSTLPYRYPVTLLGRIQNLDLDLDVENLSASSSAALPARIEIWHDAHLRLRSKKISWTIVAKEPNLRLSLEGDVRDSPAQGVYAWAYNDKPFDRVDARGLTTRTSVQSGLQVLNAKLLDVRNSSHRSNNQSSSAYDGVLAQNIDRVLATGIDVSPISNTQRHGVYHESALTPGNGLLVIGGIDANLTGVSSLPYLQASGVGKVIEAPGAQSPSGAQRLMATATVNPPSAAANTEVVAGTMTVEGARVGQPVRVGVEDAGTGTGVAYVPASWVARAVVTAAGVATVYLRNQTGGTLDLRDTKVRVVADSF